MNKISELDKNEWDYKEVTVLKEHDLHIYVLQHKKTKKVFVGFSDLPKEKLHKFFTSNKVFLSTPKFCNSCKVLTELDDKFNQLTKETDDMVNKLLEKSEIQKTIRVVGLGYGGGLATLYGIHIKSLTQVKNLKIYTFGGIKVGDQNFAKYTDEVIGADNYKRIVYKNDPVAITPLDDNLKHAGSLYVSANLPVFMNVSSQEKINQPLKVIYFENHFKYDEIWKFKEDPVGAKPIDYDIISHPTEKDKKQLDEIINRNS